MPIRPTEAVVDLSAIAHNYRLAVALGGRPAMGIVKADAYGHGALPVAQALVAAGAPLLAVALVEEGIELRQGGIEAPLLVMGAAYGDRYDLLVTHRLTPIVFTAEHVSGLAAAARAAGVTARAHLKVDTGMGRIGLAPGDLPAFLEALQAAPEVELEGVCTHFASADLEPRSTTARQAAARLRPALTWRTAIIHLKAVPAGTAISYGGRWVTERPSLIATLPIGYADGYDRRLSGRPGFGRAEVLVGGRRCPVAGTVCMDMLMADVTDVPGAKVGDEAVLLGAQGEERISADELASKAGTISYEILCAVGRRVPRRYL